MTERPLYLCCTFDMDMDQVWKGGGVPTWEGLKAGPGLRAGIKDLKDDRGGPFVATWFIRADEQVRALYGTVDKVFDMYPEVLRSLGSHGDELAWHPHLYKQRGGSWVQETDPGALVAQVEGTYNVVKKRLTSKAVRIGEAYQSPALMAALDRLGLCIDSSALPGRVRHDELQELDWGPTPQAPYHPSKKDHRVPGTDALRILEVPMSMVPTKVPNDKATVPRYVNLAFHGAVLEKGLKRLIKTQDLLVTVTHPFELMPAFKPGKGHQLISFEPSELRGNLELILRTCRGEKRPVEFVRMSDIVGKDLRFDGSKRKK
jgi:hypothetical protein